MTPERSGNKTVLAGTPSAGEPGGHCFQGLGRSAGQWGWTREDPGGSARETLGCGNSGTGGDVASSNKPRPKSPLHYVVAV